MPVHGTERLVLAAAPEKVFSGYSGHCTVGKASKVVVPAQAPSRCSQRMDIPAGQGVGIRSHRRSVYRGDQQKVPMFVSDLGRWFRLDAVELNMT